MMNDELKKTEQKDDHVQEYQKWSHINDRWSQHFNIHSEGFKLSQLRKSSKTNSHGSQDHELLAETLLVKVIFKNIDPEKMKQDWNVANKIHLIPHIFEVTFLSHLRNLEKENDNSDDQNLCGDPSRLS